VKLTALSKALLAITILSVFCAAAWFIGVKDLILGSPDGEGAAPSGGILGLGGSSGSGPLGSESNPLKVSIVSFHGYAPALLANGKSLTTQPGSVFAENGVHVEFVIQDNVPTLTEVFESDTAHCSWRTSDFWAQEQPNLRGAGHDAKAIMVVDNTQGADAIISTDPSVKRVEDLAGKSVALLEFTPSHGMLIDALESSSLSGRKKKSVSTVFINIDEGTAGVRAALESGSVEAAALWDPDLSLAMRAPGAHVVYSTKTATNLIYDVIVCDTRYLDDPANESAFGNFVAGWMAGVDLAESNPSQAADALARTEEMFALLAKDQGAQFISSLFDEIDWTNLADNIRILGLAGGTNHYARVYRRFDGVYRGIGALANPNAPVINPQESFDYRFIKALMAQDAAAKQVAAKPQFTFSAREREKAAAVPAQVTKPILVTFKTGSSELTKRAESVIDDKMVSMIENNGSAYFELSGNTDSTGGRAANVRLSRSRAEAVTTYLVDEWEFERARFKVVGNGPDKPLCDEENPGADDLDLDGCRAMNRTVRLGVLAR